MNILYTTASQTQYGMPYKGAECVYPPFGDGGGGGSDVGWYSVTTSVLSPYNCLLSLLWLCSACVADIYYCTLFIHNNIYYGVYILLIGFDLL